MKLHAWTAIAALALGSVAAAMCPFTTVFSQYGSSCAPVSNMGPILSGSVAEGDGCGVVIDLNVQQPCGHCGQYVSNEWLLIGINQLNLPTSNGCSLLTTPEIIMPLPPAIGSTFIEGSLPNDPAMIGLTVYMQGILTRVSTLGGTTDVEFSNGLEMRIDP